MSEELESLDDYLNLSLKKHNENISLGGMTFDQKFEAYKNLFKLEEEPVPHEDKIITYREEPDITTIRVILLNSEFVSLDQLAIMNDQQVVDLYRNLDKF